VSDVPDTSTVSLGPPIKALIVDDEAPARSELRYLLEQAGGAEVVGEAGSANEARQLIAAIEYDVVFLDIEMPGLSGLDLAAALAAAERSPSVVFVTAYSEHALKAFEVAATDYLVKPVSVDRLRQALARVAAGRGEARSALAAEEVGVPADTAPASGGEVPAAPAEAGGPRIERIPVEKSGRTLLIPAEEILYIEAQDDYSRVHTAHGRYLSALSLTVLEERLEPLGFFRVHRSYLVSLARVREVLPMYGGMLVLRLSDEAGTQIPVSRRRAAACKRALGM
jgi:DNA-binding LytR/AlgR family response regulator